MTKASVAAAIGEAIGGRRATVISELGATLDELGLTEHDTWRQEPHSGGLGWGLPCALGMKLADPDRLVGDISLLLADNRFPELVRPVCEAARRRGIPIVLDADRPTVEDDPLFCIPTHVIFSGECLRATTGLDDLSAGLQRMAPRTEAFLAVSDGPGPVRYLTDGAVSTMPVFKFEAIDTLAAGDVFHAGIALALAEGRDAVAAMRFGAAAAGLKCTRFGGSMGAPKRDEVEAFLSRQA